MAQNYLATTVYEESLKRLNFVFDECDDIVVSMSGGKDSTVLYELTRIVARERGRLPVKVFWLDQEAEWQATEDYVRSVMYDPEVEPWWHQVPFRLTNSLSFRDNYMNVWGEAERERWLRPQDPISVKVSPIKSDRFHELITGLPQHCGVTGKSHVGVLVGMKASESLNRRMAMTEKRAVYKGITWCRKMVGNTRVFWPIYDWLDSDIWTAIGSNHWNYNKVYDQFYRLGVGRMRVSALIHETAWHSIQNLHEIEPGLYDRFLSRVNGVNCFNQFREEIMPTRLPPYFASWRDYRDYLLENLIEPQHHETFRKRWAGEPDEDQWYRINVKEVMVNDIDGTIFSNFRSTRKFHDRAAPGGRYEQAKEARRKAASEG
jgi:predicted phosphoadenosine phosphosulfate sulfurtransferase